MRRAEHDVEIGALVADRQLEQVAAVFGADALGPAHEVVELGCGGVIPVVVDSREVHEHRGGRPQLGQKLASAGTKPLVDRRQDPRSHQVLRQRVLRLVCGDGGGWVGEPRDDPDGAAALAVQAELADLDPVAERLERGLLQHDLVLAGLVLGGGKLVDEGSGENVDQLDLGVADDESSGRAHRDCDLEREPNGRRRRRDDLADRGHRLLHGQRARGSARPVVAVEPACDRVAAEVDDLAAEAVELGDDGVEDEIEAGGQLLGATLRPELVGERLRQRCEPGDVREQGGAANPVGQRDIVGERPPPVA